MNDTNQLEAPLSRTRLKATNKELLREKEEKNLHRAMSNLFPPLAAIGVCFLPGAGFRNDFSIQDFNRNLEYEDIQDTVFAKAIEEMYCFAYWGEKMPFGFRYVIGGELSSVAMGIKVLHDLHPENPDAKQIWTIVQCANTLSRIWGVDDAYGFLPIDEGKKPYIDIEEAALISGFKPKSIREAIYDCRRKNRLKAEKTSDLGLLIRIDDYSSWLHKNGLYRGYFPNPVRVYTRINFEQQPMKNIEDFLLSLSYLIGQRRFDFTFEENLKELGLSLEDIAGRPCIRGERKLENREIREKLSGLLEIPPKILEARYFEAQWHEAEKALKNL